MRGDLYPKYSFREMAKGDLRRVHRWRNHPDVRKTTSSLKRIPFNKHCDWFNSTTDTIKLIFQINEKPEGVVTYDKRTSYWSFYLRPSGRLHSGLGRLMLSMFLVYAKKRKFKVIKAKIIAENYNSLNLHLSLGFVWTSKMDYDGTAYYEKEL